MNNLAALVARQSTLSMSSSASTTTTTVQSSLLEKIRPASPKSTKIDYIENFEEDQVGGNVDLLLKCFDVLFWVISNNPLFYAYTFIYFLYIISWFIFIFFGIVKINHAKQQILEF